VPPPAWLRLWWLPQQLPFQPIDDHRDVGQQQGKGILWVDFDQIGDWDEMRRVFAEMKLFDFEFAMVGHLIVCIGPGVPGVEREDWYDADVARRLRARTGVRYLKAFALREAIGVAPIADRELPRIYRREVFFLVSDRWIITRRRRGMSVTRGIPDDESDAVDYDELRRTLEERWRNFNEPHDAATLILRVLADSWLPAITRVGGRLQNSELAYVRGLDDPAGGGNLSDREYRQELVDLKWVVDGLSSDFTGLLRPGVPVAAKWFSVRQAADVAGEVDELLELAREEVGRHREQLRESFDLIATTQTSRQIELAGEEQRRGRRLELVVALATTVLLVPALIATTFDAVPEVLANRGNLRLGVMLALMAAAAAVSFLGLRLLQATGDEALDVADERPPREHAAVLAPVALALPVVFAAAALVGVWQAPDRAAGYAVALLLLAAFLLLPRVIAPWFGPLARLLFGRVEERRAAAENRTAQVLSDAAGTLQMLLWFLLAVFVASIAGLTFDVWGAAQTWMLRVAFASGVALYVGLQGLWMVYAARAAAGDRADALSGDVTLDIEPPFVRSAYAGVLAVAAFVAGAALGVYAVWG